MSLFKKKTDEVKPIEKPEIPKRILIIIGGRLSSFSIVTLPSIEDNEKFLKSLKKISSIDAGDVEYNAVGIMYEKQDKVKK